MSDREETTIRLARHWDEAHCALNRARTRLAECQDAVGAATAQLGKRIGPTDIKDEEEICLWVAFSDDDERLLIVDRFKGEGETTIEFAVDPDLEDPSVSGQGPG